jgi:hypothetical protein
MTHSSSRVRSWISRWIPGPICLVLLGMGSLARGVTLDHPVSVGGAWSWKAAEIAAFIVGEPLKTRSAIFGGAFMVSVLLAWGLHRKPGILRPIATILVAADLALCGVVGDSTGVACHGLALALMWWPAGRHSGASSPMMAPGSTGGEAL